MADSKISELNDVGLPLDTGNVIPIVDVSGTWTTKKISLANLKNFMFNAITAAGDLLYGTSGCTVARLAGAVGNGYTLEYRSGAPVWSNAQPFYALTAPITSACFTNSTFVTGTTIITGSTTFSGIPAGAKSIKVTIWAQWVAVNNNYYINLTPYNSSASCVVLRSQVAGLSQVTEGTVPLDASGRFNFIVAGSACTGTYINVWGYTY